MSNVTALQVQAMHKPIPDLDLTSPIPTFITDAEDYIKARFALCGIDVSWTDTNEPAVVKLIIKHMATWYELKKLYGSQVEEFHEWIRDFETGPDKLIQKICDKAETKSALPPGMAYLVTNQYRSTTKGLAKIFTFENDKDWIMHPDDTDKRYGIK